eukprot:15366881-Ditylum_brightwellii.AAC.2
MTGPLDRWVSLNVEMDTAVKARQVIDEQDPPQIQHTIKNEMWYIYKQNSKGFTKISTKLDKNLLEHIKGSALGKYLVNHYILDKESLEEVEAREKKAQRYKTEEPDQTPNAQETVVRRQRQLIVYTHAKRPTHYGEKCNRFSLNGQ